jgi:pSer/pThr/pTyr-binding forkhead associated (FHA) protein
MREHENPVPDAGGAKGKTGKIELVGRIKGVEDFRRTFTGENILIGNDPDNDVVLDAEDDTRCRFRIYRKDREYYFKNLDPSVTLLLNGEPVEEDRLSDGDGIWVGTREVLFSYVPVKGETEGMEVDLKVIPETRSARTIVFFILASISFVLVGAIFLLSVLSRRSVPSLSPEMFWGHSTDGRIYFPPLIDDVDRDGEIEIVFQSDEGSLYCLAGSDGTCDWKVECSGESVFPLSISDLDGDDLVEIVSGCAGSGVLVVKGEDGSPVMDFSYNFDTDRRYHTAISDFDGDGVKDIAVLPEKDAPFAISGKTGERIPLPLPPGFDRSVIVGLEQDISGDGIHDFLMYAPGEGIAVYDGRTFSPVWSTTIVMTDNAEPLIIDTGPGRRGIIVECRDRAISCLDVEDGSTLWRTPVADTPLPAKGIGELDGDDAPEILVAFDNGKMQAYDASTGRPEKMFEYGETENCTAPVTADVNRDGVPDVISIRNGSCISLIDGKKTVEVACWPCSGEVFFSPGVTDIDGDGWFELVFGSANGALYVFTFRHEK